MTLQKSFFQLCFVTIFITLGSCGIAYSNTLSCRIMGVYHQKISLGDNATDESEIGKFEVGDSGLSIGQTFQVNLENGKISGYGLASNDWADKIVVLNPGGLENSFATISVSGGGAQTHSMYFEVALFSESHRKPFTLLGYGGPLLSGSCSVP